MAVREVDCNGPGMRRKGAGKGFTYTEADGTRIDDVEVIERIKALAIPPAWTDVWICSDPNGHIQATGVDAKGRTPVPLPRRVARGTGPREVRQDAAVRRPPARPAGAGRCGPGTAGDAQGQGAGVRDPDAGAGLLPDRRRDLRRGERHLRAGHAPQGARPRPQGLRGVRLRRQERAAAPVPGGRPRGARRHRDLASAAGPGRCRAPRLEGRPDLGGHHLSATSTSTSRQAIGEEFSAKDFRTWIGTVLAAAGLAAAAATDGAPSSETAAKRAVLGVVRDVAEHLGNTPAVARSAYIDPRVVEGFEADDTIEDALTAIDLDELEHGSPRGARDGRARSHHAGPTTPPTHVQAVSQEPEEVSCERLPRRRPS